MAHENLISRTDAKIRYARLHLKEMREYPEPGRGHEFERAHQEAFFSQLFGAYAALFHELNQDLGCDLEPKCVTLGNMRNEMKAKGFANPKLTEIYSLEQDPESWLSIAKSMRDHISHIAGISLAFYAGGPEDGVTSFRHPITNREIQGDCFDICESFLNEMESLIVRMRDEA